MQRPRSRIVDILGVCVHCMGTEEVLALLSSYLNDCRAHSVYYANAHTINLACKDPMYRRCLNEGDLVLNDGLGVHWAARLARVDSIHRHYCTDLVPAFLEHASPRRLRIYLLGGVQGVAQRAASSLALSFPHVEVAGHKDGYEKTNDISTIEEIRAHSVDLLLVGMGQPLQERWIARHSHHVGARITWGVGGLLDYLAGSLRRAPLALRRAGLEWFYILLRQPWKWRRYLFGIPVFASRVMLCSNRTGSRGFYG